MATSGNDFLGIELKAHYFDEFKICGIPIPQYNNTSGFTIQFRGIQDYLNYVNVLKLILSDLETADPENTKYEIHRSKCFIVNLLQILRNQYSNKYN
ncbi:MAG: hypothetical protein EOP43_02445 [Sphingobacteriaceae bacterium]|nr:MAG: hypothetical protein EOP43_02445 [Sphingobacteriaceae bacterium]